MHTSIRFIGNFAVPALGAETPHSIASTVQMARTWSKSEILHSYLCCHPTGVSFLWVISAYLQYCRFLPLVISEEWHTTSLAQGYSFPQHKLAGAFWSQTLKAWHGRQSNSEYCREAVVPLLLCGQQFFTAYDWQGLTGLPGLSNIHKSTCIADGGLLEMVPNQWALVATLRHFLLLERPFWNSGSQGMGML